MFGPFTTDTIFPAFQSMGVQFQVDAAAMQQVTSVYMLAFAGMSLFHGPLSDALGRRPVIIASTAVFALASVGCALAPSLPVLLFFRAIQGLCAGGGTIVARAVIPDLMTGPAAQRAMGQVQMIFGLAPAAAPILGGWLLKLGPWPVIFWFLAVYGVVCLISAASLPESHPRERRTPLHPTRVLKSLSGVLTSLSFLRMALAAGLGFGGVFTYIGGAPLFVVNLLGKGERDFWILFVPLIIGIISGSWTSGRLAAHWSRDKVISLGFVVALIGALLNVLQAALHAPPLPFAVLGIGVMSFGMMMQLPAIQLRMMDHFPDRRGAVASGSGFLQLLLGAAVTAFVAPHVAGSLLQFAIGSLCVFAAGGLFWCWHLISVRSSGTHP
ncbi:Bcr/CflA family drug resistance efflux transporter [Enemella dayhoffiae]|uniref:Bcr/CflA family drug resistance efflux transporter n=2 Tax=Enemella dayhoffiae TaxID=2016507 RepID=A0A255H5D3_9ACTN|nr:Bcr/CflA family drug resistance efflux transporter [Enemella dayhoffiae]